MSEEANTMIVLGITNIACGVLFILLSLPLLWRKIPMNPVYGMRFARSFSSEENWYRINVYGAKRLIIWSVVLMVIGLTAFVMPPSPVMIMIYSFLPLLIIIPALESYRYTRTL